MKVTFKKCVNSKQILLYATTCLFCYLSFLPYVTSSKYVVHYNLFCFCLTYFMYLQANPLYTTFFCCYLTYLPYVSSNKYAVRNRMFHVYRLPYKWWQSLDRFIPLALNQKDCSKGGLNQKLISYMHAFVW